MTRSSLVLLCLFAAPVFADKTPPPPAYTATVVNALFGNKATLSVWRDGPIAVTESSASSSHVRSYLDVPKGHSYAWDTTQKPVDCSDGHFSGDWGDPFSQDLVAQLQQLHPKNLGTETVNGFTCTHFEAQDPTNKKTISLWVDNTYGEIVKWVGAADKDGALVTLYELTSLKVGKPAAEMMVLPDACQKLAAAPPPQSDADRIAALTGSAAGTYISAATGAPSTDGCVVEFTVVDEKTMAPTALKFRLAADTSVGPGSDHPPAYNIGTDINQPNKPFFAGGGLKEITNRVNKSHLVLGKPPRAFEMELWFEGDHFASALIYRQCRSQPRAKLYFVVTHAGAQNQSGEWVWGT